jgi:hypothetical protein
MRIAILSFAALAACGGEAASPVPSFGPGGGYLLSGTVAGASFDFHSQLAGVAPLVNTGKPDGQAIAIVLTSTIDETCGVAFSTAGELRAQTQLLTFGVGNQSGPVTLGTYKIPSEATAQFIVTDAHCADQVNAIASAGSVTFTKVGGGFLVGSFDLAFAGAGSTSGYFELPICEQPSTGAPGQGSGPPGVCQP